MPADSFAQILADTVAAEQAAAAASTPAAEPVADAAPAAEQTPAPAAEPVAEAVVAPTNPAPTVALSLYNQSQRAAHKASQEVEQLRAGIAERDAKLNELMGKMAAQAPAAAAVANKTATDQADWLQQLIDAGAEMPPELVNGIRSLNQKLASTEERLAKYDKHFEAQAESQAMSNFEAGYQRLTARCAAMQPEEVLEMLADGVRPERILAWNDQLATRAAPAPAAVAAPAQPKSAPMPRLDGAPTKTGNSAPENESREDYISWLRGATQH